MAVIRDMMPAFKLFQPTTTDEALGLLEAVSYTHLTLPTSDLV